ncbi:unnamed protein product [Chrysoparadoxa australica]
MWQMSQGKFLAVQCYQCNQYAVQQQTKGNQWSCCMCGSKQSIVKIFGSSNSAKDIRPLVQQLAAGSAGPACAWRYASDGIIGGQKRGREDAYMANLSEQKRQRAVIMQDRGDNSMIQSSDGAANMGAMMETGDLGQAYMSQASWSLRNNQDLGHRREGAIVGGSMLHFWDSKLVPSAAPPTPASTPQWAHRSLADKMDQMDEVAPMMDGGSVTSRWDKYMSS